METDDATPRYKGVAAGMLAILQGDEPTGLQTKRQYSTAERKELAKKGQALPDGSYPIVDAEDLDDAIRSIGRSNPGDRATVKAHIRKRARALGKTDMLPQSWGTSKELAMPPTQEERAAACGIAIKKDVTGPPEGFEDHAGSPELWADYTHYDFPLTPERLNESQDAITKAADYDDAERATMTLAVLKAQVAQRDSQLAALQGKQQAGTAKKSPYQEASEQLATGHDPVTGAMLAFVSQAHQAADDDAYGSLVDELGTALKAARPATDDRAAREFFAKALVGQVALKAAVQTDDDGDNDAADAIDWLELGHSAMKALGYAGCSPADDMTGEQSKQVAKTKGLNLGAGSDANPVNQDPPTPTDQPDVMAELVKVKAMAEAAAAEVKRLNDDVLAREQEGEEQQERLAAVETKFATQSDELARARAELEAKHQELDGALRRRLPDPTTYRQSVDVSPALVKQKGRSPQTTRDFLES